MHDPTKNDDNQDSLTRFETSLNEALEAEFTRSDDTEDTEDE